MTDPFSPPPPTPAAETVYDALAQEIGRAIGRPALSVKGRVRYLLAKVNQASTRR
jgi:hypothetical protein